MKLPDSVKDIIQRTPWDALLLAFMTLILLNLASSALMGDLPGGGTIKHPLQILLGGILGLAAFAGFVFLYHQRQKFASIRTLSQHACEAHRGMMLMLTYPSFDFEFDPQNSNLLLLWPINEKPTAENSMPITLKNDDLSSSIKAFDAIGQRFPNKSWNLQQLLRAFLPHYPMPLTHVYIMGSPESVGYIEKAEALIRFFYPDIRFIHPEKNCRRGVSFEDINELSMAITQGIGAMKSAQVKEKDIIIDVTGGQKTASIAGALVTLHSRVTFQYVKTGVKLTNTREDVLAFDMVVDTPSGF